MSGVENRLRGGKRSCGLKCREPATRQRKPRGEGLEEEDASWGGEDGRRPWWGRRAGCPVTDTQHSTGMAWRGGVQHRRDGKGAHLAMEQQRVRPDRSASS